MGGCVNVVFFMVYRNPFIKLLLHLHNLHNHHTFIHRLKLVIISLVQHDPSRFPALYIRACIWNELIQLNESEFSMLQMREGTVWDEPILLNESIFPIGERGLFGIN